MQTNVINYSVGMFSKSCKYGIKAVLFIAKESWENRRTSIDIIAERIDSPKEFTHKVLQRLVKTGIVKSVKGKGGGFEIENEILKDLKLSEVVEAIDGDELYTNCILGLMECNHEKPCPVHKQFLPIKKAIEKTLKNTLIISLLDGLKEELTFLKI